MMPGASRGTSGSAAAAKAGDNVEIHATSFSDASFVRGQRWTGAGGHVLEFTQRGNLELKNPSGDIIWESATARAEPATLVLQRTGNLVLRDWRGYPVWSIGTNGHPGAHLALQRDGNLVLYSAENLPLWETRTAGR
jgi:hypothetical protein